MERNCEWERKNTQHIHSHAGVRERVKTIIYLIIIDMCVQLITRVIFDSRTLLIWGNLLHGFLTMAFFLGFWINDLRLLLSSDIPRGSLGTPSLFVFSPRA